MENSLLPQFINPKTGEALQFNQLTPKAMENALADMPDALLSSNLSQINLVKRVADKMEKAIKDLIRSKKPLEFNESNKATFEDWQISRIVTKRFSEKKLIEEGTEDEKELYFMLKEKYTEESETIKFG